MVKKISPKTAQKTIKKTSKKIAKNTASGWFPAPREASTMNDAKNALLLVSLIINLGIFIAWLILKVTNVYDAQVYNFLFSR